MREFGLESAPIRAESAPAVSEGSAAAHPGMSTPAAAPAHAPPAFRVISARPPTALIHANPFAAARHLYQQRHLVWRFAVRDVQTRYKGSFLGVLWSFIMPLLLLAVYTFVFGVVFRARWEPTGDEGTLHFAIALFAGLIVFHIFSECVTKATTVITSHPGYVKRVVFPLEALPLSLVVASLINAAISFLILVCGLLVVRQAVPLTIIYLPLVLLPLVFLTLGCSWFLASLGVFIRDATPMVSVAVMILMFLSAVFYPAAALPENLRWMVEANPIALVVDATRATLVFGGRPSGRTFLALTGFSLLVMQGGYLWFMRTKRWFADVI